MLNNKTIIRTTSYDQNEIIKSILKLHCNNKNIECDVTYSKGNFYKTGLKNPKFKFDLNPRSNDTIAANCLELPLKDKSLNTIMFDPPFAIGSGPSLGKHKKGQTIIGNRFGLFRNTDDLLSFYNNAIKELSRILKDNGTLIFKCQDVVGCGKNHFSHCFIMNKAIQYELNPKDLFILIAKNRIISGKVKNQIHARKYHCYFWVFKREKIKIDYK